MEETILQEPGANQPGTQQPQAQEPQAGQQPEPEKTFTRDELNKIVAAEKRKAAEAAKAQAHQTFQQAQEEEKKRQSEAERFSKMQTEDQVKTLQEKLKALEKEKAEILCQNEAEKLRQAAVEKASKEGLPLSFVSDLNYRNIKAEELDDLIKARKEDFQKEVTRQLNLKLPNKPPETHKETTPDSGSLRKAFGLPENR